MIKVKSYLKDQQIFACEDRILNPKISVILSTHARYTSGLLVRAVNSVLKQSFKDFEFIIIDDGSTDGSFDYLKKVQNDDTRVILIRHDQNSGLPGLRYNEGIVFSSGEYISFQFDDDYWPSHTLETLYKNAISSSPKDTEIQVGRSILVSEVDKSSNGLLPPKEVNENISLVKLYNGNHIANNSVLVPRRIFQIHGMYDPHIAMRRYCDWDLWLRLSKYINFNVVDKIVSYVEHSHQGAIGKTTDLKLSYFRYLNSLERGQLLLPDNWENYEIDSLKIFGTELPLHMAKSIYEDQIVPYYTQYRLYHQDELEGFDYKYRSNYSNIIYLRHNYDVGNEISFEGYQRQFSKRRTLNLHFATDSEVLENPSQLNSNEGVVFVRTISAIDLELMKLCFNANIPIAYHLDDDLIHLYQISSEFDYLRPGSINYQSLMQQLKEVDCVWVSTKYLSQQIKQYNPRRAYCETSIDPKYIPDIIDESIIKPSVNKKIKIGYVGGGYRKKFLKKIWLAFQNIAIDYGHEIELEFWGMCIDDLPKLPNNVKYHCKKFRTNYYHFLEDLKSSNFDVLIIPHEDDYIAYRSKALNKFVECVVANAVGIFSNTIPYEDLSDGENCIKTENTPAEWEKNLRRVLSMSYEQRNKIVRRASRKVKENYSKAHTSFTLESAWYIMKFHQLTRVKRHQDGMPRILFFLHSPFIAGAEIEQWRRIQRLVEYGVKPVIVLPEIWKNDQEIQLIQEKVFELNSELHFLPYQIFTEPINLGIPDEEIIDQFVKLFNSVNPALVHTVTYIPIVSIVCKKLNIPHVATLYAIRDDFQASSTGFPSCDIVHSDTIRYSRKWQELLDADERYVSRSTIPENYFNVGENKLEQIIEEGFKKMTPSLFMAGTFQPRKNQLGVIKAANILKEQGYEFKVMLKGYKNFYPDYVDQCYSQINKDNLENFVEIQDFSSDITQLYQNYDYVICGSNFESLPSTIKESFATSTLVISTKAGGITELVIDGVTGFLAEDDSPEEIAKAIKRAFSTSDTEKLKILENARKIALYELHPRRAVRDLFDIYTNALKRRKDCNEDYQNVVEESSLLSPSIPKLSEDVPIQFVGNMYYPSSVYRSISFSAQPIFDGWKGLTCKLSMRNEKVQVIIELKILAKNQTIRVVEKELILNKMPILTQFEFLPIENSKNQDFTLKFTLKHLTPSNARLLIYQDTPPTVKEKFLQRIGINIVNYSPGFQLNFRSLNIEADH